jgi:hypothetical protein
MGAILEDVRTIFEERGDRLIVIPEFEKLI